MGRLGWVWTGYVWADSRRDFPFFFFAANTETAFAWIERRWIS